jgi:DNA-binding transcriptional ArsR family regulator
MPKRYVNDPAGRDPFENPLERQSFVGLYPSPGGIQAIDGQVKVRILEMLERQEMAFDDLVSMSGRAKSTVSVHLRDLTDTGIVGVRADPADARKKMSTAMSERPSPARVTRPVSTGLSSPPSASLSCHGGSPSTRSSTLPVSLPDTPSIPVSEPLKRKG